MKIMEAEKVSLNEDISNYDNRRTNIRNIAIITALALIGVFAIFIGTGQLKSERGMVVFMIVLALAAVLVLLFCIMLKRMEYKNILSQKKNARAIVLLNKIKIKYVNAVNTVEYEKEKYGVKNSYELSKIYATYLEEKKREEKYRSSAVDLEAAYADFENAIKKLNLYDPTVWTAQREAIVDDKEMKALKNKLDIRRQKLKDRIMEYFK